MQSLAGKLLRGASTPIGRLRRSRPAGDGSWAAAADGIGSWSQRFIIRSMSITIRPAQHQDRAPARELARCVLLEFDLEADFDGIDCAIGRLGDPQRLNLIECVCEVDGQFAGCLAIHALDASSAKLAGFYIDSRFRGHGLGRAMLVDALTQARRLSIEFLHLQTMKSMTAAVHLYQTLGWQHVADLDPASGVDTAFVLKLSHQGDNLL